MHIDYAAEQFAARKTPKHSAPFSDHQIVEMFAAEREFVALALALDNEKITDICTTMQASENTRYSKVTAKQKWAVADALLAHYKTALEVYAAAMGVEASEFQQRIESL